MLRRLLSPRMFAFIAVFTALVLTSSRGHADSLTYAQQQVAKGYFDAYSEMIAHWAHPTLEVVMTRVMVSDNKVRIAVDYRQPDDRHIYTVLSTTMDPAGAFRSFRVESDTSFVPAFLFMNVLKGVVTQIVSTQLRDVDDDAKNRNELLRQVQRVLRERWEEMSAADVCTLVAFYHWVDKGYWQRFLQAR